MKAYTKRCEPTFYYPEQMTKILKYLETHGTLHVNARTVEKLYFDFSETHCASWLIVSDEILEEFADYLAEIDL